MGRLVVAAAARAGLLEPALEALHPTAGVDELLLARVERVALGADLHVELFLRRARPELVSARARHVREDVVGVDVGLHRLARIPAAVSAATFPPETMQTVRPPSIFPASTAATAAAPAGSHASFARSYRKRNPVAISSSVTSTTFATCFCTMASALRPACGAFNPSAIEIGVTSTRSPAASAECSAVDASGSTPITRA